MQIPSLLLLIVTFGFSVVTSFRNPHRLTKTNFLLKGSQLKQALNPNLILESNKLKFLQDTTFVLDGQVWNIVRDQEYFVSLEDSILIIDKYKFAKVANVYVPSPFERFFTFIGKVCILLVILWPLLILKWIVQLFTFFLGWIPLFRSLGTKILCVINGIFQVLRVNDLLFDYRRK
jgi:hypothetical protein